MGVIHLHCIICKETLHEEYFQYSCLNCYDNRIYICDSHKLKKIYLSNCQIKISDLFCCGYCETNFNKEEAINNLNENIIKDYKKEIYIEMIELIEKVKNNDKIKKIESDILKLKERINKREDKKYKIIQSIELNK